MARLHVGAEGGDEAAGGGVDEDRGKFDDFLRVDLGIPFAGRLKVDHDKVVELPRAGAQLLPRHGASRRRICRLERCGGGGGGGGGEAGHRLSVGCVRD